MIISFANKEENIELGTHYITKTEMFDIDA